MDNPIIASMRSACDEMKTILVTVERNMLALEKTPHSDLEEEADLLDSWRELLERFKVMDSLIVSDLSRRTPRSEKLLELPRGGTVEIRRNVPRKKWDHEAIAPVVVEKIIEQAIDKTTGTINEPYSVLMLRLLDYAGVGYWKVGTLKDLGIDPDNYCEAGIPKATATIRHGSKR